MAANTPAEHARIAQSYRDQAKAYLAEARKHQAMIAAYKSSPNMTYKNQAATINHCEYFVANSMIWQQSRRNLPNSTTRWRRSQRSSNRLP